MTPEQVRAFVRLNHRGVLATTRRDGRPQLSPVLVGVDAEGYLVISTSELTVKTTNVRRERFASVCVFEDAFFGEWIQAEGEAHVYALPDAMESLVSYYRAIAGEHPDWDEYRAAMQRDKRVLLRIRIDRVTPAGGR